MIPLKDDLPSRTAPVMTVSIITLNVLVFLYYVSLQLGISLEVDNPPHAAETAQQFILEFGLVPCRLMGLCRFPEDQPAPLFTVFSSMFLHGSFFHIGGNMLYLWIFGDNVEDWFGRIPYLVFYLLCGVAATFAQLAFSMGSTIPSLGASGAIAGVLGAYILLFPGERITVLFDYGGVGRVPANIVIGLWFVLQLFSGFGSVAATADTGGVAYMAHVGGFVAGLVITFILGGRRQD